MTPDSSSSGDGSSSWDQPVLNAQIAAVGVTALLESIRRVDPGIRFYQAFLSEVFGQPMETPQSERTPLNPLKGGERCSGHSLGLRGELWLGDLHARRDWGSARDYMRAMWLMLQRPEPDDFVVATGVAHSVEELVACAFKRVGLDWQEYVQIDESLQRGQAQLRDLVGDASKAHELLGREPTVSLEELVHSLVDAELDRMRRTAGERSELAG